MRMVKGFLAILAAGLLLSPPAFASGEEEKSSANKEMVAEAVKEIVETEVARMVGDADSEWEISEIKLPDSSRIPASFDELTVTPAKSGIRRNRLSLRLKFFNNGKLIKRLNASAQIEAFADVVVSKNTLDRGSIIISEMLLLERKAVNLPLTSFCTEVAQVVGQVTNRRIVSGQVIRKSEVSRPPDVKAGDVVMIVAENMNVKITARGIAREDGAIGDMIAVTNMRSNKKVFARVTGGSAVRVVF